MFFYSCGKIFLSIATDKSAVKKATYLYNDSLNKTVIFVPMQHIGKPNYYEEVRLFLDSLRKNDFVVFYENIGISYSWDSLPTDTLIRKMRKIVGMNLVGGYKNPDNKSLKKHWVNSKYISQANNIGLKDTDFWVDLDAHELIEKYEERMGKIVLTECDCNTPLFEKYKCKDTAKIDKWVFTHLFRNKYIFEKVIESEYNKIVLVYGKGHKSWICHDLKWIGSYKKVKVKYKKRIY